MRYFIVTYMQKADGRIDEVVTVSKNLKHRDLVSANIILDYKEKKIFKCRVGDRRVESDWQQLDDYYKEYYPDIIKQLSELSQ